MSPNMFSVTITSKCSGRMTRAWAAASTYRHSAAMSGYSAATSRKTWRKKAMLASTLAPRRPAGTRPRRRGPRSGRAEAELGAGRGEHGQRRVDQLRADAVAADHGDRIIALGHIAFRPPARLERRYCILFSRRYGNKEDHGPEAPAPVRLGSGPHTYELAPGWGTLPAGWDLADVAGVAVDRADRVFVFNRGDHPMVIFDRDGNVEGTWGEDFFSHAHGIFLAADQSLYCTDDGNHTMTRHAPDGELLMQIGRPGEPAPFHGGLPFNRCTHTALSPEGDIYVSDGYGNARVHKFSPNGRLLLSWGRSGMGTGEFNLPHNIVCDEDGWVYVADRENHRIQVFDGSGRFEASWGTWSTARAPCTGRPAPIRCSWSASWVRRWTSTAGRPASARGSRC